MTTVVLKIAAFFLKIERVVTDSKHMDFGAVRFMLEDNPLW